MAIVYLCSFCTILILAGFVWDTVKIPWSMFRNKPVKFSTAEYLMDRRDWKEALIFTIIFAIGLAGIIPSLFGPGEDYYTAEEVDQAYEDGYNYARRDYIDCPYCDEEFPERLSYKTYQGDTICPDCMRGDFNALLTGEILLCNDCGSLYDPSDSYGIGLCYDCAEHVVTECYNCCQPIQAWPGQDDFGICPDCMGELMNDKAISRAINNWFE